MHVPPLKSATSSSRTSRHFHRGISHREKTFLIMAANKSRIRRTRVVPNRRYDHRPSSCMAGRRPSHFFKIVLPSTIDDKKLVIPSHYLVSLFVFQFLEYSGAVECRMLIMSEYDLGAVKILQYVCCSIFH
jgi:hypothetical protein